MTRVPDFSSWFFDNKRGTSAEVPFSTSVTYAKGTRETPWVSPPPCTTSSHHPAHPASIARVAPRSFPGPSDGITPAANPSQRDAKFHPHLPLVPQVSLATLSTSAVSQVASRSPGARSASEYIPRTNSRRHGAMGTGFRTSPPSRGGLF